ncbi:ribonuclease P protein subunit p14 [Anthonomus grandis grandis]|uniref:ribonuclease P protein subunit p14 n=1 Tax=Anthonomus grandis grandis TaxID=2921223 RepID=UPI00216610EB|nr:ribonuclease P protein subunit p14 [Anthonomus grandis grandis]
MSENYYLDVKLILQDPEEVPVAYLKKNILEALRELFGEIGATITIDILKFNPETLEAIIRVPESHYIKLRGSLTLCGRYEGKRCIYSVRKSTPVLLALQGDSRNYIH